MKPAAILAAMSAALPLAAATPETTALVAAAEAAASAELRRPLALAVQSARMAGDWGFVLAELRGRGNEAFDFHGTRFEEAAREGYLSRRYAALLVRRGGAWQVVESRVGATDVAWAGWAEKHQAPAQIFAAP